MSACPLVEHQFQALAQVAGLGRIRPVGRQLQQRVLVAQLLAPVVQLALALTGLQPAALPQRVVAVVHLDFRQRRLAPRHQGVVAAHEFVDQDVHRPAVGDDVMQGQQQHMLLGRQAQQGDAEQRAALEVEGLGGLGRHLLVGALPARGFGQISQVEQLDAYRRWLGHPLHGALAVLGEGGAQAFVAADQQGQAVALAQADTGRHGQLREIDTLASHPFEEQATLVQGQLDETAGKFLGVCGIHRVSSLKSLGLRGSPGVDRSGLVQRVPLGHRHDHLARAIERRAGMGGEHVVEHHHVAFLPEEADLAVLEHRTDLVEHFILDGRTVTVVDVTRQDTSRPLPKLRTYIRPLLTKRSRMCAGTLRRKPRNRMPPSRNRCSSTSALSSSNTSSRLVSWSPASTSNGKRPCSGNSGRTVNPTATPMTGLLYTPKKKVATAQGHARIR
ncbi:hypothetical protein WR25_05946 [Diploscapter pachys]|uniref:Uncharacterized protein n=1 Tax=Diploscapter pachys TaxID=2018661 RepID=A0A2A2KEU3_9BILA|nr:hypothetical protein WR25_05946 [Diploscapter pachys]